MEPLGSHRPAHDRPDPLAPRGAAISIGNFDGVHLGHQVLLKRLCSLANRLQCPSAAVVFDPHPVSILRPDAAPEKLTTLACRAARMETLGVDFLLVCRTSKELLQMTADAFFEAFVVDELGVRGMVEGPNFFFGKNRAGNVELLQNRCEQSNISFEVAEPFDDPQGLISSSRIRDALRRGDVSTASELMGNPHQVTGQVHRGAGRGKTIGFPTANLSDVSVLLPAPGVYGGVATLDDGTKHVAAIHLGKNPTFEQDGQDKLEIHLLDYRGDSLYGQSMTIDWHERIRGVQKFESADELTRQLQQDIASIRDQISV